MMIVLVEKEAPQGNESKAGQKETDKVRQTHAAAQHDDECLVKSACL